LRNNTGVLANGKVIKQWKTNYNKKVNVNPDFAINVYFKTILVAINIRYRSLISVGNYL
jgi:hypothetical protein